MIPPNTKIPTRWSESGRGLKDGQGSEHEGRGEAERQAFSAVKKEGFVRTLLLSAVTSPEDTEKMGGKL